MEPPRWPPAGCPGAGEVMWEAFHARLQGVREPSLDFAEVFAGTAAASRHLQALGYTGRAVDLAYSQDHDVLAPTGLLLLLQTAFELKPGGVLWAAPPCSSWVFMNLGSTGRHVLVEGNFALRRIVGQSALVERLVLVLELLTLRGVYWILEQPASSYMWQYPAMQACLQRHGIVVPQTLEMGAYGGGSQKPTHLVGTAPYLAQLDRRCSAELKLRLRVEGVQTATTWVGADGKRRRQGTSLLKSTQSYPEGFGAAHALAFRACYGEASCGTSSAASSYKVPRSSTGRGSELWGLLSRLPDRLFEATDGAWWLRDWLGEPF